SRSSSTHGTFRPVPRIASPGAVDRFVEDHLGRWSRLADLVSSAAGRVNRLKADEVLELGRLYRAVTGDLAIAQRDFPGDIVRIAIVAFAGGLTAGLLTAYVLITNGAFLGTVFAVLQNAGLAWTLLTFVSAHGFLELSAIVLSGAAGLRFAWAILQPGERTRGSALRLAGTQAMRIIFLVIVVLGCAGLLEVYVSPTNAPAIVKVAVGLGTGTLLWAYALFGDRLLTLRRRQKKRFFSST